MKNLFTLIFTIAFIISCSSENSKKKTSETEETINTTNSVAISVDGEFNSIYEYKSPEIHKLLGLNFINDTTLQFQLIIKHEDIFKLEGRAYRPGYNMDPEIDEDEDGIGYPAIEYYYKRDELWLAIRVEMTSHEKVKLNFADNKKLEKYSMLLMNRIYNRESSSNEQQAKKDTLIIDKKLKRDTLMINQQVYYLDSISESEFKVIEKPDLVNNENEIIDDTLYVTRDSLILTFHLRNGADSVLINDYTEGYSHYINYSYLESCKHMDYWLLKVTFYEGYGYMLFEKENGNKIWIWGKPIYSPNNKYFLCNSFDLEAGYNANGLQLFEIKNNNIIHRWSKEIDDWGPTEIRWKNDSIALIEQTSLNFSNPDDFYSTSYISMTIK